MKSKKSIKNNKGKEALKVLVVCMIIASCIIGSKNYLVDVYSKMNNTMLKKAESSFDTKQNEVALIFEVDCDTLNLKGVLDVLKERNISATFFVCSAAFSNDNETKKLKMIADSNHAIANHSMMHTNAKDMSASDFRSDLEAANKVIYDNTKKEAELYKFPYNSYDDMTLDEVEKAGLVSICSKKRIENSNDVTRYTKSGDEKIAPGDIIEFNVASKTVIEDTRSIIDFLINEKYTCISLNKNNFSAENKSVNR